jgi:hypothetical protein
MPVIISVDGSESESDNKKQDVYGVIIRDKLREKNHWMGMNGKQ